MELVAYRLHLAHIHLSQTLNYARKYFRDID